MFDRLFVLLTLLHLPLAACSDGPAILVSLQLGDPDPFQGVTIVRLEASGPPPMEPLRSEASRSSNEISLPAIPYGPGRRIVVEGLDEQHFVISRGQSEAFEVTASGPDRINLPFARCTQNLYRDEDGDGFGMAGPPRQGCKQAGWAEQGDDCNDKDAEAHPGQLQYFSRTANGTDHFDFNCNGNDDLQTTAQLPSCATSSPCKGEGWSGSIPRCGEQGSYGACTRKGPECVESTQPKLQVCR